MRGRSGGNLRLAAQPEIFSGGKKGRAWLVPTLYGYNRFYIRAVGTTRFLNNLEQVHVRRMISRFQRFKLMAGLGLALLMPALAWAGTGTTTTVTAAESTVSSCTVTTLTLGLSTSTAPLAGTVTVYDSGSGSATSLGTVTLGTTGSATVSYLLGDGAHTLYAVYAGDDTYTTSTSTSQNETVSSQCSNSFILQASSLVNSSTSTTGSLTAGQAGTSTITVIPNASFVAALSAPAYVEVSCSGLPDQSYCSFSPTTVEFGVGQYASGSSTMILQTEAASTAKLERNGRNTPIAWAFLLPGLLGLGGMAFAARRNRVLQRLSLVMLLGIVTMLGTTGCNPRYSYYNHGPSPNGATPSGTYTVKVTGQYNNGLSATSASTTVTMVVK